MLSIQQVYTSGFRPRMNGATELVHRFLNTALGVFCEKNQERWEECLQPAVYTHTTAPISGTSDITPFFLAFGHRTPSPETIALNLPPLRASADQCAHNLVSRMKQAHAQFPTSKQIYAVVSANCRTSLHAIYKYSKVRLSTCAESAPSEKWTKNVLLIAFSNSLAIHMASTISYISDISIQETT